MFIIHWVFDKLGYMPKVTVQIGKLSDEFNFPEEPPKPAVKKPVVKKTASAKKAK
jgi:hypothetical protein